MSECWRSAILGDVETELRSRFGALLLMNRGRYDGAPSLSITWPGVGSMLLNIGADFTEEQARAKMLASVDMVTEALWCAAPVAGRC